MLTRTLATLATALIIGAPGAAQEPQGDAQAAKPAQTAPAKPSEKPAPQTQDLRGQDLRQPEGMLVNVRIELTITDQRGDATPITKTVTMMASDRSYSRIRTSGDVRTPTGFRPVILNVDARPAMLKDNRVRVDLTIEYRPVAAEAETEKSTTPSINESLSVILEDGKSMLISQSADPVTDRKVKVEAKVSISR